MARITTLTYSFNVGEKSKAGLARVDQEGLKLAAEIQENILPRVVGAGQVRPGTQYLGSTRNNFPARYLKFVKSVTDTALVELTDSALRVWIDDVLVTRVSVGSTVTNGDFSSSTGWTLTTTGGAAASINSTVANALYMVARNKGGKASCVRSVTTSSAGTEHALRIIVLRGPVRFRCGSSSGDDDYITESDLDTGTHSLAFTPTGTYYVYFETTTQIDTIVDSIQVESAGVMEISAPWTNDQISSISYDQSGDVLFLANGNWQPRKIERRSTKSWSVVLYKANDGPFTLATTANVRLNPIDTYGNVTLSSDSAFFKAAHVGALFRLTHDRFAGSFGLGGGGQFSNGFRVSGVGSDNDWAVTIAGTWSGVLTVQRGYTNRDSGFISTSTTYNTAGGHTFSPGSTLDNVIQYYRIGFVKDSDYGSGSAQMAIEYTGDAGAGVCRVTSYISPTQVSVEVLSDFKSPGNTGDWQEGEWSDLRGWPTAVAFFDGRLWWARADQFWGSISDQFYSFTLDEDLNPDASGDAGSIQRNIATGGSINTVQWILPLQRLIFGTSGAETNAQASSLDQPLTPTACTLKDVSTQGSAPIQPVKIDGRGIFVQRSGTKVYELSYGYEDNGYAATNLMRLNEDIGLLGITALETQRQPETYIWMVRGDGQAPLLIYEPKEKVAGFVRIISDGASGVIENIVTLPGATEDRVYFVVRRTINGSTVRYLEKLALRSEAMGASTGNKMADCHTFAAGPTSSVTASQLANQTGLIACGFSGSTFTVLTGLSANGSGVVSLGQSLTNVCVGLPYTWRYKSAKLAFGTQGTPIAQPKIVKQIGLLLADFCPAAINYGDSFSSAFGGTGTMYSMPTIEDGQAVSSTAVQSVYDNQTFPFGTGNWNTDSRVCLAGAAPYPATLLGLVIDMQTNE